jgi:hypothetical protein
MALVFKWNAKLGFLLKIRKIGRKPVTGRELWRKNTDKGGKNRAGFRFVAKSVAGKSFISVALPTFAAPNLFIGRFPVN